MQESTVKIELLPAQYGDCLWVEYGVASDIHRILIDGGPVKAYPALKQRLLERLESLPKKERHFDLLIITHVDDDHIGGILEFLVESPIKVTFDDVWFNAWSHLPDTGRGLLNPVQGEQVSAMIKRYELPWNKAFDGGAVVAPDLGSLPQRELRGGMNLTIMSPTLDRLRRLRPHWKREVEEAGLVAGSAEAALEQLRAKANRMGVMLTPPAALNPEYLARAPFRPDRSVTNGSSIAVLLEYEGRSCLLTGDAFAEVLEDTVSRLAQARHNQSLRIDAMKLAHHGSRGNTSSTLLTRLHCGKYLVSTNGALFGHPDRETIARVIVHNDEPLTLYFNYHTPETNVWDNSELRERYRYETVFPLRDEGGITVQL